MKDGKSIINEINKELSTIQKGVLSPHKIL